MFAVTLLCAEEIQKDGIAMLCQPHRGFVEEGCPLEWRTVKTLTLSAVAMLGINGVAVVLELDWTQEEVKISKWKKVLSYRKVIGTYACRTNIWLCT